MTFKTISAITSMGITSRIQCIGTRHDDDLSIDIIPEMDFCVNLLFSPLCHWTKSIIVFSFFSAHCIFLLSTTRAWKTIQINLFERNLLVKWLVKTRKSSIYKPQHAMDCKFLRIERKMVKLTDFKSKLNSENTTKIKNKSSKVKDYTRRLRILLVLNSAFR